MSHSLRPFNTPIVCPCCKKRHLDATDVAMLELLATGASDEQVAGQVFLAYSTVKNRFQVMRAKFGVSTRFALVMAAVRDGVIAL